MKEPEWALAVGDYNNDGLFDIYVTNIFNHQPNPLFKNLGNRRFENVAEEAGVWDTGWGWGTHFFDFDHDGDEDLAAVNGVVSKQYIEGVEQTDVENFFFKNMLIEGGMPTFIDHSSETKTNGEARARGLEVFDYDGDGDLDMVVANVETTPYLYRNDAIQNHQPTNRNWIKIKLEGTVSNRNAFGTEVKITIGDQSFYRWHHGAAFYAQSIKPVHFGVGEADMIDELQVTWLSGAVETFENIPTNQTIRVREGGLLTNVKSVELDSQTIRLQKIAPNPFKEFVDLSFELSRRGQIDFRIYSLSGQLVHRQIVYSHGKGQLDIRWNGKGGSDAPITPGMYFYTARFDGHHLTGKLVKVQ